MPGHDVDEEVELVVLGDGHGYVVPLQGSSLVVLVYSRHILNFVEHVSTIRWMTADR